MVARTVITVSIFACLVLAGCGQDGEPEEQAFEAKNAVSKQPVKSRTSKKQLSPNENKANNDVVKVEPTKQQAQVEPTTDRDKTVPRSFRAADLRPRRDDKLLANAGIFKYESKRLILYTDIDPAIARTLPPLLDQAYVAWEQYFGPLPPARDASEFQMTGYVIKERERFEKCNVLPQDLPVDFHGQQFGYEFWMNDQTQHYYRRHLLIHEGTHCFMTSIPGLNAPMWYMEGMAELFATHTLSDDGKLSFRVMPTDEKKFLGWGRISLIHEEFQKSGIRTPAAIQALKRIDTVEVITYAWSWALCKFLDTHPRYRSAFKNLAQNLEMADFYSTYQKRFVDKDRELQTAWAVFAASINYGYDFERNAITFEPGRPLSATDNAKVCLVAVDQGWQSSRVHLKQGMQYEIRPSGRFSVAQEPKPWASEANGITFRYCRGRPLGMLLAAIRSESDGPRESMLDIIPIGAGRTFTAKTSGTLYFRINEFAGELDDNRGSLKIEVRLSEE